MSTKLTILTLLLTIKVFSQETPVNKNIVSLGIGGAGMTLSGNYERAFSLKNSHKILAGYGLGYFPLFVNGEMKLGTFNNLLKASYLYPIKNHHIEAGITNCFSTTFGSKYNSWSYYVSPSIGYCYHNFLKNGIVLKFAYTPLISFDGISVTEKYIFYNHYFSLSFGWGF